MDIKPRIAVLCDSAAPDETARLIDLAACLKLPFIEAEDHDFSYFLTIRGAKLELRSSTNPKSSALAVDYLSGPAFYRFVHDRRISQPLARAVGIKRGYRPTVLDGTAGFGEDAFVIASLGCRVTMIERSPVIWALLNDAILRTRENRVIHTIFAGQVKLVLADTIDYLSLETEDHDTVYLDPMYPTSPRSPLNKQKMRTLRHLVGDDPDGSELLTAALDGARRRVAVKRPLRADPLDDRKPSFAITAKSSRFDIYLTPYL